jgi:dTDP-L-rhamnose 4-epimerase
MSFANERILITGGAGFIGSHLANSLAEAGAHVRVLDVLAEQVHGADRLFPTHLHEDVETLSGDVRNPEVVANALRGITHVCHLAAAVGVGQSMYEIDHYVDVNTRGTAVLLQALLKHPVQRLVVASSMSIYGEGLYRCDGAVREPPLRSREQLSRAQWDLRDGSTALEPVATPESKRAAPASVYALSKLDQEQLCLLFGNAYNVPTVALRFFNVYGPLQALSNPYTGVLAIFAARCLNDNPPLIFEDGMQRRDFVSVRDIVKACQLALSTPNSGEVFNIGSGRARSILEVANAMIEVLGARVEPVITGKFRAGDIRHCFADIDKARRMLGYQPSVAFEDGLTELAQWLAGTRASDNFLRATAELDRRGLTL